jgi:hypothetical protein
MAVSLRKDVYAPHVVKARALDTGRIVHIPHVRLEDARATADYVRQAKFYELMAAYTV